MTVDIRKMVEEQLARRDSDDKLKRLESENEELKKKLDEMGKKMDEFGKKDADKKDADKEKEDAENEDEEDENKDEKDEKTDSIAGRLKWFERRKEALEVAARVDAQVSDKLDILDIKRAVVKAVHGQLPRTDSAYISAAYDIIKSQTHTQSREDAYSGISQAIFTPPAPAGQQPTQRQDSAEDAYMKHFQKAFQRK